MGKLNFTVLFKFVNFVLNVRNAVVLNVVLNAVGKYSDKFGEDVTFWKLLLQANYTSNITIDFDSVSPQLPA